MSKRVVLSEYPSLPISGRRGSSKLATLKNIADWKDKKIKEVSPERSTDHIQKEASALKWAIQQIIELEETLSTAELYIKEHLPPASDRPSDWGFPNFEA